MNPELQTVVDRLELVEQQSRSWKTLALLALLVSLAAIALPYLKPAAPVAVAPTPARARYAVVEANRFLLRDVDGAIAGGMEAQADGSLRLVLGGRSTPSAHLIVPRQGGAQLTLRDPGGKVQVGLGGSEKPSIWLSPDGQVAQVSLGSSVEKGGEILVRDPVGRPRFHAP